MPRKGMVRHMFKWSDKRSGQIIDMVKHVWSKHLEREGRDGGADPREGLQGLRRRGVWGGGWRQEGLRPRG